MHPMRVVGVRVELPANQPVVLLREEDGVRYLPIWIGAVEASATAFEQQGVLPARPLTHDLLRDVIGALGARLEAVHITDLRDGVFYAELVFAGGARVSARPSDAIALALRSGTTILGEEAVLAEDLALRAAVAIDNARLYESSRAIAQTLQASLLPPHLPELPGSEEANRTAISLPYFTAEVPELVEQYATAFEKVWARREELEPA